MSDDLKQDMKDRVRRSLGMEIARMEDDFDETRDQRKRLTDKLMQAADAIVIVDSEGVLKSEVGEKLQVFGMALKSLSEIEKANSIAINLKLKNQEQEIASNASTLMRIEIMRKATLPGKIETPIDSEALENKLAEMFDSSIQDFELKTNNKDLSD